MPVVNSIVTGFPSERMRFFMARGRAPRASRLAGHLILGGGLMTRVRSMSRALMRTLGFGVAAEAESLRVLNSPAGTVGGRMRLTAKSLTPALRLRVAASTRAFGGRPVSVMAT